MRGWVTVVSWLLARLVAFVIFVRYENDPLHDVSHDVHYFGNALAHIPVHGLANTLVEYPLPGVLLLALPWLVAHVLVFPRSFVVLFAFTAVALDAALTSTLARRRAHRAAMMTWILGVPLLGALGYFRFDLLPAVLAGYAVLNLAARPRLAQTVVAAATAVKFWPALMIAPVVASDRDRWRALGLVGCVGGALAALTVAVAGWSRLLSPLTYEAHRGLQIESVWATPAMLGWAFGPARWLVHFSSYKALEVAGYGVPALLTASTVSEIALAATLVVLWGRLLRRPVAATAEQVAWVSLAGVTGFVVTGKVLSPQYLLWLLAIVVAGLAVSNGARAFRTWAAVLLMVVALTHGFIPEAYQGLARRNSLTSYAVSVLVARNVLLLWLLGSSVVHAWRATATAAGPEPVGGESGPIVGRVSSTGDE
jgi:hypothetical protein